MTGCTRVPRQMIPTVAEPNPRISLVSAYRLIEDQPDCFGVPVGRSSFPGTEPCSGSCSELPILRQPFHRDVQRRVVRGRAPSFFPENRFFMAVDIAFRIPRMRTSDSCTRCSRSALPPETVTDTASHFNWWPLRTI